MRNFPTQPSESNDPDRIDYDRWIQFIDGLLCPLAADGWPIYPNHYDVGHLPLAVAQ